MLPDSYDPKRPGQGKINVALCLLREVSEEHFQVCIEQSEHLRKYYLKMALFYLEKAAQEDLEL